MWATGTGSEVMKRIAAPMVGGIFTSFVLELLVYPPIYEIWRWNTGLKSLVRPGGCAETPVRRLELLTPVQTMEVARD
jgi:Cu(I)/Ag(I) efflux system membrane protein CusA/SilA